MDAISDKDLTALLSALSEIELKEDPCAESRTADSWKDKRFNEYRGYSFWLNVHPIKTYVGYDLPQDICITDYGYVAKCAKLLQVGTNMLVIKRYGNEVIATTKMLADYLGIHVRNCQQFLQRMEAKRVLKRQGKQIYMNPIYYFRGRYLTWNLYNLFQDDLDFILPQWVIDRFNGDANA